MSESGSRAAASVAPLLRPRCSSSTSKVRDAHRRQARLRHLLAFHHRRTDTVARIATALAIFTPASSTPSRTMRPTRLCGRPRKLPRRRRRPADRAGGGSVISAAGGNLHGRSRRPIRDHDAVFGSRPAYSPRLMAPNRRSSTCPRRRTAHELAERPRTRTSIIGWNILIPRHGPIDLSRPRGAARHACAIDPLDGGNGFAGSVPPGQLDSIRWSRATMSRRFGWPTAPAGAGANRPC
jgi:hypothetical protein